MVHTLTKPVLRELLASTLRENAGAAPGDMADHILELLSTYSPKAFINDRLDVESDDKLVAIAKAMVATSAYNLDSWEIAAAYPRLTSAEVDAVNDLIGMSNVTVEI